MFHSRDLTLCSFHGQIVGTIRLAVFLATSQSFVNWKELHECTDNRGISSYTIDVQTVTTRADAALKNNLPGREAALRKMNRSTRVLGTLRHLVSRHVNVLADGLDAAATGCELILDTSFLYQLFVPLCNAKLREENKKVTRKIDVDYFAPVKAHLVQFIRDRVEGLPQQLKDELQTFPRGAVGYLAREMLATIKRHVGDHFDEKVSRHLHCLVDSLLWGQRRHPNFAKLVKSASVAMLRACLMPAEEGGVCGAFGGFALHQTCRTGKGL